MRPGKLQFHSSEREREREKANCSFRLRHGAATVRRYTTNVVVNALPIQSDIECLRRLEAVAREDLSDLSSKSVARELRFVRANQWQRSSDLYGKISGKGASASEAHLSQ